MRQTAKDDVDRIPIHRLVGHEIRQAGTGKMRKDRCHGFAGMRIRRERDELETRMAHPYSQQVRARISRGAQQSGFDRRRHLSCPLIAFV